MTEITTSALEAVVEQLGHKVKSKTGTSMVVLVKGSRLDQLQSICSAMSNLGAEYDPNMTGSSIGGIRVGKIRILIKADGKTGGLDVEVRAQAMLHEAILSAMMENGGPIDIKMDHRVVKDVVGVEKTPGTPKSDFHLVDKNKRPCAWLSHKKGSKPTDFQQWGGVTEKEIANHKEVIAFGVECKAKFGDKMPSSTSVFKEIKSKELKGFSVFGVDYGKRPGINNVDALLQGDPGLEKKGSNYELTANHVHYNGDIPTGGFEPVLNLTYKGDRTNLGIKGARASIYPMLGRKMTHIEKIKPIRGK